MEPTRGTHPTPTDTTLPNATLPSTNQRLHRTRRAATLITATALAASCAGGSNASPSTPVELDADAAQTEAPATPTNEITSTTAPPTTSTTSTTTALAPTTTLAPSVAVIDETCTTLTTSGYETRKAALAEAPQAFTDAGGVGDGIEMLREDCGDAVARLEAAQEVEARGTALGRWSDDPPVQINLRCQPGVAAFTVVNLRDIPIGVHVEYSVFREGSDERFSTSADPIVVWSIEPGESEYVQAGVAHFDGSFDCGLDFDLFDATVTDADASLPTTEYPEFTGDDPAVWFPKLIAFEFEADGSGDADRAAVTEDLRSTAYPHVLDNARSGTPLAPDERPTITVCELGRESPDENHISFVYFAEYPERTVETDTGPTVEPAFSAFRHALFRRGADGQWRWLSAAAGFDSTRYYDSCGTPSNKL